MQQKARPTRDAKGQRYGERYTGAQGKRSKAVGAEQSRAVRRCRRRMHVKALSSQNAGGSRAQRKRIVFPAFAQLMTGSSGLSECSGHISCPLEATCSCCHRQPHRHSGIRRLCMNERTNEKGLLATTTVKRGTCMPKAVGRRGRSFTIITKLLPRVPAAARHIEMR